jgi:hypothetical protein
MNPKYCGQCGGLSKVFPKALFLSISISMVESRL